MRLKENFFDDEAMKIMEGLPDGYLYSNILLKMYLASLKTDGRLMLNNVIPYNAQMIASVTGHQIGTVEKALRVFKDLGLIEILDNGAIYMLNIQNFIGQTSTEADRKREYDRKISTEKKSARFLGDSSEISPPDIEIETNTELEIEKKEKKPARPRFVPPTIEEVTALVRERGYHINPESFVRYYESNGWKVGKNPMKDWKAAAAGWESRENKNRREAPKQETPKTPNGPFYRIEQHQTTPNENDLEMASRERFKNKWKD